ncbi:MAG TPA: orotidine-5'-phosphate decarboxylase [Puia sp.]|nr:orotidine-5'-phosphate decarboxylase [Puia sp.]
MTRQQLVSAIRSMGSYLSVGLDTDPNKIPRHLGSGADAVFEFNRRIIDATKDHCVAYKINTAFYESGGSKGWEAMERTVNYIPATHFRIADAKRGDIGNTSTQYARAFFEAMPFDAITVAPYMGWDSVRPFLEYKDKWTIVLALTSNPGSEDFELKKLDLGEGLESEDMDKEIRKAGEKKGVRGFEGAGRLTAAEKWAEGLRWTATVQGKEEYLYERVLRTAADWGTPDNLMFVIGATQVDAFERVRRLMPDHFFLVPGVGAQGGSLEEISKKAMNKEVGLLVNASRAVIYASGGEDFAEAAGRVAAGYQREMQQYIS